MKDLSRKIIPALSGKLQYASAIFCSLSMLLGPGDSRAQSFSTAVVPNEIYPIPITTAPGGPMVPTGTYKNGHTGGSCYNSTVLFNSDTIPDQVYVWALNYAEVTSYNNYVAYEVVDGASGSVLCQGKAPILGEVTELNVGMYGDNRNYSLAVAYWNPSPAEIRLRSYSMSTTGTLTQTDDQLVASSTYFLPARAPHISMDSHDMQYLTIAWDDLSTNSIYIKDYTCSGPPSGIATQSIIGSSSAELRFPDVAMSHQSITGTLNTHLGFVDITSGTIYKYTVNFGGGGYTMEDMIPGTPVGPRFDEFQLKIDAPDHYTAPQSNWSMVYYNNDAHKINLRMCNNALSPAINSYVVNDGTLTGSSGDISMAGNAFPSVSYNPEGNKVYVAWFSTYDEGGLSPASLYSYQNLTVRYLSVIVDDNGSQVLPEYQKVDANYRFNWIYDYPKICLSKHNESDKLFTVFTCHGPATTLPLGGTVPVGINAKYLAHKATSWSTSSPYYRPASVATPASGGCGINIYPNPFSQSKWFRLNGGCDGETYTASLMSIEGRLIATYKGTVDKLNTAFASLQSRQLVAGVYTLKIMDASGKQIQQQLLIKQ